MNNHSNVLRVGSNEMELVDFRIFKKNADVIYEGIYGVNVSKVKEIIKLPPLTELPGVPDFIEGIFDLRGVVIPVIDLAQWMDINVPDNITSRRVIIAEFNNILIGFVVHDAKRIRRINWSDIEPATFNQKDSPLDKSKITGVTRIEDDAVLLILDLESLVQELGIYGAEEMNKDINQIEKFTGLVLILDDSKTARKMITDAVTKMGFKVIECKDGEEGILKLEELYGIYGDSLSEELKLIISDVEMPRMDGFTFTSNVKSDPRFRDIPVIFNSSISDHFSEMRGLEAGGEEYLVKFNSKDFYGKIAKVIKDNSK